jgi:heptosyltransferase-2
MKIVVRGANWIGDAVMTIPALRALRSAYPDASIDLYTRQWAEGVFRDADFVDEVIPINSKHFFIQAPELRSRRFDLAILFPNSFESALVARLAGIPQRLGYATQHRGFLLTDRVQVPDWKARVHESRYYLNLVESISGTGSVDLDPSLPVSGHRRRAGKELLRSNGVGENALVIGFGAGSTNSLAKRWPAENFARLADLLTENYGAAVVLLGAGNEADVSTSVTMAARSNLIDLTGKTDLGTATALLSELDVFISNDMGLAHIAAAVGTPTIVIFGPTNDVTTRPLGRKVVIIREPVECSPCMLRECPIDHRCMTRISPERVFETAAKMLETRHQ